MLLTLFFAAAVAVQLSPGDAPNRSICADPSKRREFLEAYKDPGDIPIIAKLRQRALENRERFFARANLLAERAHWSAERKAEFSRAILSDPEYRNLLAQADAIHAQIMKKLEPALAEKDDAKRCGMWVDAYADLPAFGAILDRQWMLLIARVDAEAKKAGVKLD